MADRTKPARPPTGPPLSGATVLSSFEQTPYSYSSGSLEDTSERWAQIDCVLREELRSNLRFDIPDFVEAIFGQVLWLDKLAEVAFGLCRKGENPKYSEGSGWTEWPPVPSEGPVLNFLEDTMLHLKTSIENEVEYVTNRRRIYARPRDYFAGSGIKRRMNAGVEKDDGSSKNDPPLWEKILVVAELKSNPLEDHHELTFVELAQYAREVFLAQDRRFVLGFTLCGSIMRLWQFDRSGSSGSVSFDINKDGPRFVRIMLGYYLMSDKQLGVDPTIQYSDGKRYIDITREGQIERLVIIEDIRKQSTVVGRATTCWRAHCGENSSGKHLVIKDSWQYTERSEEGELIRKATENGVQNIARYYHHETVQIDGKDDDIFGNVRRGLMKGAPRRKFTTRSATRTLFQESFSKSMGKSSASQKSSRKRVSSPRPRSPDPKRSRSNLTMNDSESPNHDRIHRLVITYDPGKRIDEASSCLAIINGLLGAVSGK